MQALDKTLSLINIFPEDTWLGRVCYASYSPTVALLP